MNGKGLVFTPGHLAVLEAAEIGSLRQAWKSGDHIAEARIGRMAGDLEAKARTAKEEWLRLIGTPFAPECLTISLGRRCNLACGYCYASDEKTAPGRSASGRQANPSEEAVRGAAQLVARSCAEKGKTFCFVVHGRGEPTLQRSFLERYVQITRQAAEQHGVGWFGYIAVSGVMPEEEACRLAWQFDLIGLSCDGPRDIQDKQRPLATGRASSPFVERTARAIIEAGGSLSVRATITPESMTRQAEIVAYLNERLRADTMRFEPVYGVQGRGGKRFRPEDAELFAEHFLEAQREAQERKCELSLSGARLDEIHGPYCHVLRDVLHLTPDGSATACSFFTDPTDPAFGSFRIGRRDSHRSEFVLDRERIAALRRRAAEIPGRCQDCLNVYHCARECPEICPVLTDPAGVVRSDGAGGDRPSGFRCLVYRRLTEGWIEDLVLSLPTHNGPHAESLAVESTPSEKDKVAGLLAAAETLLDVDKILRQWEALKPPFSIQQATLPLPVWARRGFDHDGSHAWRQLSSDLPGRMNAGAMSIYIHVPFCDRRCGFCNSYSMPLGKRHRKPEEDYVRALLQEMEAWAKIEPLGKRPVTTVHFGGGTPNYLDPENFACILRRCRELFGITRRTEWALESTSSLLTDEHLEQLKAWGFTRLHVGVQTLEDLVRLCIGRRETAEQVKAKLTGALKKGFIVSVDVMYGLPGQTLPGLLRGLDELADTKIHGFSLYGLHVTDRNLRFLKRHGAAERDMLRDYIFAQAGEQRLVHRGFHKTHFTHFARPEDSNLYYSFPQRGEDLLALGPTADGVFGDYHYRHPELEDYVGGSCNGGPVLEGGVWENAIERGSRSASVSLMSGSIGLATLREADAESVLDPWLRCALVEKGPELGRFALTANGSWFINGMIEQISDLLSSGHPASGTS